MDFKALGWHFVSHFSLAFTVATLVVLGFNLISSGVLGVANWAVPFGVAAAVAAVTTAVRARA